MQPIPRVIVAAVLALSCACAQSAAYIFSYTFADGDSVTGSFSGIASGNLIDSLSNITLSVNGTTLTGPITGSDGASDHGPAVASFDGTQNMVLFRNVQGNYFGSTDGGSDYGPPGTNLFYLAVAGSADSCDSVTGQAAPGFTCPGLIGAKPRWSISAVPEP